jgi:integrase
MADGTELERRDRALVAFLFLTGSRETAAVSLSLGQIDLEHGLVQFDGRHVDTKFGKSFTTAFFPIGGPAGTDLSRLGSRAARRAFLLVH